MPGARATFRRIAVALIDVPEGRLSAARAARVETIAKTSRAIGLLQPVNVEAGEDGRFRLIAGAKRLAALIKAGEAEIDDRVIAAGTLDEAGRRLIEIVENLDRQDLTKLERAEHLVALKSAHEVRFPDTKRGGRRGNQHSGGVVRQSEIFAFSQEAAEMTGLSRRAIEVAVQIVSALCEDSKVRLRGSWLEDHQAGLKLLSEQKPAVQGRILDILFASPPEAASVADALALVEGRRLLSTAEKLFASTLGNWSRLSERQRASFLDTHEAAIRAHARARGWFR